MSTLPDQQSTSSVPAPTGRVILTVNQVRDLCRVSRRTVYYWMQSGRVAWRELSGKRYVYADSIDGFADLLATKHAFEDAGL